MSKFLMIAGLMAALAAPAGAVTINFARSGDTTDVPFFQLDLPFSLAASEVSSAVLNVTSLFADDAIVVSLNSTPIVGAGIFGPGNGNFFFTEGGPSTPFTFNNNFTVNGSFAAPFVVGNNVLRLTVNNNNAGINTDNGPLTGGLGSYGFTGTVTADSVGAVPEPATWGLMITGFGIAGVALRRRSAALAA